jgi:hypothetical protein
MNKLVWHNNIIFNSHQMKPHIIFIKRNLCGLLPLYPEEYQILKSYAMSNKFPIKTLVSMRNTIKTQEEIYRSHIGPKSQSDLEKSFRYLVNNINTQFEQNHKYLVKKFFAANKFSVKNILKIISGFTEYKKLGHDTLKLIFKYMKDIQIAETNSRNNSMKFEDKLNSWLKNNVSTPFKTENMLRSEYTTDVSNTFNSPNMSTPDVLFDKPIIIKLHDTQHKIYWIDAKNYALVNVPFIIKSLKKQSDKYNKAFGPGAFVFHYGISSDIKFDNTLVLDGSFII